MSEIPKPTIGRSPCPTCGCTLYRESGPCEGVEYLDLVMLYRDGVRWARSIEAETEKPNWYARLRSWLYD